VALSTLEKEAADQWQNVLSSFDQLVLTGPAFPADEALAHLRSLASADGPVCGDLHSPVQVLEPGNAAALHFDHSWLVGASELEWPPVTFAPAFIPFALQRAENLKTGTAGGRREAAQKLSGNVRRSAASVVVSFSSADASDAKCSLFFSGARPVARGDLHVWEGRTVLDQLKRVGLEMVDDTKGPPLPPGITAGGGTHLLKSQSVCPFQAFVRWRLQAEGIEESVFSFDARDRGNFLHKALANVWRAIETSQRLRSLAPDDLERLVAEAVKQSLASDPVNSTFRAQLREAEQHRLTAVIIEWLKLECGRPGEFRPRDIEKKFEFQLSRLPLTVRVDRIDETPDGRLIVIDYKSGRADRKNLDSDRPQEPQLLVYAAMESGDVDGLYFGRVRRGESGASGYGRIAHFGDKKELVESSWKSQLAQWTAAVTRLAQEFESGHAPVAPGKGACDYCAIRPICRVEESRAEAGDSE
jgi:probable DNA repair protein